MHHARQHIALTVICLLAGIIIAASPAAAQGTKGVFPDPLGWRPFNQLLEPLDLSSQQAASLEQAHAQYLKSMMALRDGDIDEFMEGEDAWFKATNHEIEETRDRVASYRKISRRIDSIESNLFDHVATVLGPNQASRLQIVRDLRERRRKLGAPWPWEGFSPHSRISNLELRTIIDWDVLDQQQQQAAEEVLATHEAVRTRLIRQLQEQRFKGRVREVEIEEERGPIAFDKESGDGDIDPWLQWQTLSMERHQEAYEEAIKTDAKLRRTVHRGVAELGGGMSERAARDLRWAAWRQAYSIGNMAVDIRPMLVNTISRESGAGNDVTALEALLSSHDARTRPHYEQAIREYDQQAKEAAGSFLFMAKMSDDQGAPEYLVKLHEEQIDTARALQAMLAEHSPQVLNRMLATIDGEDVSETETVDRYGSSTSTQVVIVKTGEPGESDNDVDDEAVMLGPASTLSGAGMLGSIPQAMSVNDMEVLSSDLGINQDTWEIVETLHESYASEAARIHADFARKQQDSMMRLAAASTSGKSKGDIEAFLDLNKNIMRLQEESTDSMKSLDDQLFDDLVLAVENTDDKTLLRWHRLARKRLYDATNVDPFGGMMLNMGLGGSSIGSVDLMRQLALVELSPESRALALGALQHWHEPATVATTTLAELSREYSDMMNRMINSKSGELDEGETEQAMKVWELVKENAERRNALLDECRARNEQASDAIRMALPTLDAAAFSLAIRQASFPMVYQDPGNVEMKLRAAMKLDGLDDTVRAELLNTHDDYVQQYELFSDALVDLAESMPRTGNLGSTKIDEHKETEQLWSEMERIHFERNDLSAKTRDRLRNLLTEEQIRAIGGLNEAGRDAFRQYKF